MNCASGDRIDALGCADERGWIVVMSSPRAVHFDALRGALRDLFAFVEDYNRRLVERMGGQVDVILFGPNAVAARRAARTPAGAFEFLSEAVDADATGARTSGAAFFPYAFAFQSGRGGRGAPGRPGAQWRGVAPDEFRFAGDGSATAVARLFCALAFVEPLLRRLAATWPPAAPE